MSEQAELHRIAQALESYKRLDADMRGAADDMVAIINDPKATEDEKFHSAITLDEILFPSREKERIAALIDALPFSHRIRWCESVGPCSCIGCANHCGVTKSEWRRWGKSKGYKLSAWGNLFITPPDGGKMTVRLAAVKSDCRVAVIKELRKLLNIGLWEAKKTVDELPRIIFQEVPESEAIDLKIRLEKLGATIALG